MSRPRAFNESAALEAAIDCFWQRGYGATSMRELAESMGLSAPSVYNAFGDKQALFARALKQYLDCSTRDRLQRLESSFPPKDAICRFFAEVVRHSSSDPERKGCFLVNSALEIAPHDSALRTLIAAQFAEIEAFFERCIRAAQADRTITADIDAKDTARLLLGVLLGIRVLARSAPNRSLIEGAVRPALALLHPPRPRRKKTR